MFVILIMVFIIFKCNILKQNRYSNIKRVFKYKNKTNANAFAFIIGTYKTDIEFTDGSQPWSFPPSLVT